MAIYQFLIAVRSNGGQQQAVMLTNAEGETTSHIQGMFNRTIRFLTEGIKPVYVFDGQPPQFKSGELAKRKEKRVKAEAALAVAQEEGNVEEQDKQSKRLVRAGTKENDDCRKLLQLMGVPIVNAPCEAEAQASALAKAGLVYATGTEDMDALTFATPVLIRKMAFANAAKSMVQELRYDKALEGLQLTHDQFVDLCIMLGCDYCDTIKGIGPKTALKLIREHGCIEKILEKIDRKKYIVPSNWVPNEKPQAQAKEGDTDDGEEEGVEGEDKEGEESNANSAQDGAPQKVAVYVEARRLFNEHDVLKEADLKWKPCQPEELTKYLVEEMGFSAERVKSSIEKLQAAFSANTNAQTRMESFFKVIPSQKPPAKRKAEKSPAPKKGKGGGRKR
jgi:flap endonuclease-1